MLVTITCKISVRPASVSRIALQRRCLCFFDIVSTANGDSPAGFTKSSIISIMINGAITAVWRNGLMLSWIPLAVLCNPRFLTC